MAVDADGVGGAVNSTVRLLASDEVRLAARAGGMVAATTPGAPRGVIAPDGLPRAARLVAREALLDEALTALTAAPDSADPTIMTLIGVPGIGKSALAAEAVALAAERERLPAGAIWLPCEGLSGDSGLAHILARLAQLGPNISESEGTAAPRPLIALDDIEPSLDASALLDALAPWRCPLLLTARQSLQDARARDIALTPLDALSSAELVQRILRQIDPKRPTEADDEALFERLTGDAMPLALSLAAARLAIMGQPLSDLANADAFDRRASLAATLAVLPETARRAWVGLALIAGASFPRGVALAIAGAAIGEAQPAATDDSWRTDAAETLDALIGLRLVTPLATGRLALSGSIRREAAHQSFTAPDDTLGAAMAAWWLDYARAHAAPDDAPDLERENPGLLGAIAWSRARQKPQMTLDLITALPAAIRATDELRLQTWADEAARTIQASTQIA